ncbi:hypothetical protein EE612_043442 [Oryza sativa]|nr:hypothetical protein EE612_043442 [Oryza sativa]
MARATVAAMGSTTARGGGAAGVAGDGAGGSGGV